jgi:hypothetical protein
MVDIFYISHNEGMMQMTDEIFHDRHRGWRCEGVETLDEALEAMAKRQDLNQGRIRKGIYVLVSWEINHKIIETGLKAGAHFVFRASDNPRYIVRCIEDTIQRKEEYGEPVENGTEELKEEQVAIL